MTTLHHLGRLGATSTAPIGQLIRGVRLHVRVAVALVVILSGCSDNTVPRFSGLRGAWIAPQGPLGFQSAGLDSQLQYLKSLGVTHLALGVDIPMSDITQPTLAAPEITADFVATLEKIRDAGFKIMLLPRIEHPSFFASENAKWRGDIRMADDAAWDELGRQYRDILLTCAKMADDQDIAILVLGLEYRPWIGARPDQWREFAAAVRTVYSGKITYSANWYHEFEEVEFWDCLDFIGIGAYFEVADHDRADARVMVRGWNKDAKPRLLRVARRFKKPILFTEIGYPTFADAGRRPWEWTNRQGKTVDREHQAECYRAFFRAFAGVSEVGGLFVWRFYSELDGIEAWDYTPQGKPAADVLRQSFRD